MLHLGVDEHITLAIGVITSLWFVFIGLGIGISMNLVFPVQGEVDHLRRKLFTMLVLLGAYIGRIVQSYIFYGTTFREGWWVLIWSLCIVFGVSAMSHTTFNLHDNE